MEIGRSGERCFSPKPSVDRRLTLAGKNTFPAIWELHAFTPGAGRGKLSRAAFLFTRGGGGESTKLRTRRGREGFYKSSAPRAMPAAGAEPDRAMETAASAEKAENAEENGACERARCRSRHPAPAVLDGPAWRRSAESGYGPSARPCAQPPRRASRARCPSSSPRSRSPARRARDAAASPGAGLTSPLRTLCSPSCRPAGFWRPWQEPRGEEEEQVPPLPAEEVPCGPGMTEDSGKLSQYRHPVRLFWPRSKCYDYLYQEAEALLKNFPIQATISFYEDSDSEDEIEELTCENQSD
uniref:Ripply transcriptional repressor 2 n=1 Tax=Oryctolagus cuniculus TaxID=9986 RepID=G1SSE9_RABIT